MIRTINLKKYLPPYVQEYKEIDKIMETENPEFQIATDETEKILNNMFITSAEEKGIERFEKIMGLIPTENDTLESRRSRVLTRWYADLPYTYFFLIRKLNLLCGEGNYEIELKNNEYQLNIFTHLTLSGQLEELFFLVENILPVNLIVKLDNKVLIENVNGNVKIGGALSFCEVLEVSDCLQIKTNGDIKIGSAMVAYDIISTSN